MGYVLFILFACLGEVAEPMAIDFAEAAYVDAWLRHPVYGDPSFDAFERAEGNPIHHGAPPFEWPVNGFLFEDPQSGHWYIYVGRYAAGYAMGEGKGMDCVVYRSEDRGRTWQDLGPVFPDEPFRFDGDTVSVGYAPDVSVVYADGRYHLVYDWATANATWATMMEPADGADNGIGYAYAERPEGPFLGTSPAVYRTSAHPVYRGKYRRAYAATLLRRDRDWLVLAMMDSGAHQAWALVGMTSVNPEGPYSEPVFLRCVDDAYFHPPLLEFYPAFAHDGYVYAPATSVALNRNFQAVFRVQREQAMRPEAWELFQYGSVWHAEPVVHEHYGIWGQTFSGFVGKDNVFRVMFPSRDPEGLGTINVASRQWDRPYRPRGFTVTGHQGVTLALLKGTYRTFDLEATIDVGGEAAVLWGYRAPLGPNRPGADSTLHAVSLTRYAALELGAGLWRVVHVDDAGKRAVAASGDLVLDGPCEVGIQRQADGSMCVSLRGAEVWRGLAASCDGVIGLLAGANSHVEVSRFIVKGDRNEDRCSYLCTEAILGAGAAKEGWRVVEAPEFRYGVGAVSTTPGARAKWNLEGTGLALWAPKGPGYGAADVLVDGIRAARLDFHAASPEPSRALFSKHDLSPGYHAVVLQAGENSVPLDVLEVVVGASP